MPRRQCPCCHGHGPFDTEDVFPKWVRKIVVAESPVRFFTHGAPRPMRTDGALRLVLKRTICKACNGGWMHDLEDATRPSLAPMLTGLPAWLDQQQQRTLARWAAMKAPMIDLALAQSVHRRTITHQPRGVLQFLSIYDAPPPGTKVWIAPFDHEGRFFAATNCVPFIATGADQPSSLSITFTLGAMLFHVVATDLARLESTGEIVAQDLLDPVPPPPIAARLTQLWTPEVEALGWSPGRKFRYTDIEPLTRWDIDFAFS